MTSELKLDEGSDAVVVRGGMKVAFNASGITANVQGTTITVDKNGKVALQTAPANDTAKAKAPLQIGDPDDGGIYVGASASDGKPLHAALADLSEYKTFEDALAAAEQLKSLHPTAHVPTPKELDKNLFENRFTGKLAGTFNTSGSFPASVYRSSATVQYFDDGYPSFNYTTYRLPVRLVW